MKDLARRLLELRPLIAAVRVELKQEREHTKQRRKQQNSSVTILNISTVNDRV